MSFYDLNKLSERELIAQFILEARGTGAFLSHSDCKIIESWLAAAKGDSDLILFLLSEELGRTEEREKKNSKSLKFLDKKIKLRIKNSQTKLS